MDNTKPAGSLTQVGAALPSLEDLRAGKFSLGRTVTIEKATLATERATLMYGCFRQDDAAAPDTFIDAAIAILADYPDDVIIRVTDPREGIPGNQKWPPQPFEVKKACEEIYGPVRRRLEFEKRSKDQLAERERVESMRAKQTYAEFKAEMAERGLSIDGRKITASDSVTAVKERFKISDAQWNALPDLPIDHADYWAGVRWGVKI